MSSTRGTIVVLTGGYDEYEKAVVDAIGAVADAAGFGVLCVTGCALEPDASARAEQVVCNAIYRLFERADVAGLICESGTLGHRSGPEAVARLVARHRLPLVSLGMDVPGVPSVIVDDAPGMTHLMEHLVEDSRRRRFAFVRGPDRDIYSMERERIFREVLARHGRDVEEALFVGGNYDAFDAYDAVADLLRRRPDVDTIVAANDTMALSAARAVTAAGLAVPGDVAVTGFDDVPDATRLSPALTTVRQPLVEIAELGIAKLLELVDGAGTGSERQRAARPRLSRVGSELVVRGSTTTAAPLVGERGHVGAPALHALLSAGMSGLKVPEAADLSSIAIALDGAIARGTSDLAERLALAAGRIDPADAHWWSNLCHQLEVIAVQALRASGRADRTALVEAALARVRERIWASEMEREFETRRLERMRSTLQLRIGSCTAIEEILDAIDHWTEAFGPRRLFLVRYDEPAPEPRPTGRLIRAFRDGVVEPVPDDPMETRTILPPAFAHELTRGTLVLQPVYAGHDQFGYLIIDPAGLDLSRIDSAAHCIGNAMRSHHLFDALERQATRLRDANAELSTLANRDALTGLPNRFRFERYLRERCERGDRFALCFLDLDGFKLVNDTLGHEAGDDLLRAVAARLERVVGDAVGERGFVARLGGDEFTVVLRSPALEDDLERIVPTLLAALSDPHTLAGRTVCVSASIGGAVFPDDGDDVGTLLKCADAAMYVAKSRGKNAFALHRAEEAGRTDSPLDLAQSLRRALDDGGLCMHFQPRVDLVSGETSGVEALMRWMVDEPGGEVRQITPDVFIPVAEESGLITRLDDVALEESCRMAGRWARAGTPLAVAVNVSAMQFRQDGFVARVTEAVARHALAPRLLELEITESALVEDVDDSVAKLERLRASGIGVSIDDFGAGRSSLSCLSRLPARALKIDRRLVARVASSGGGPEPVDAADAFVLRSVIALGKGLGLALIAEGIETTAQLDVLRAMGCDEGQGFLLGRPAAADTIERSLDRTVRRRRRA